MDKQRKDKRKTNDGVLGRFFNWKSSENQSEDSARYSNKKQQFNNRCVQFLILGIIVTYVVIAIVHIHFGKWQEGILSITSNQSQSFNISIGSFRRCSEFKMYSNITTVELSQDSEVVDAFVQFHIFAESQSGRCEFSRCINIPEDYSDYQTRLRRAEFSHKISNLLELAVRFKTRGLTKIIKCLGGSK